VNAVECRDRAIHPRELQHDEAVEKRAPCEAAEALVWRARDAKRTVFGNELEWKFRAPPVLIDNGRYLVFRKSPHSGKQRLFLRAEQLGDLVEVAVDRSLGPGTHPGLPGCRRGL
jgi:hypothetical protein